jgi:sec-independent protein translocase protein TatA
MELFAPMHLLLVLGIALLVFGPRKLPELGKGLGEAIRGFKTGIHGDDPNAIPPSTDVPEDSKRQPPA